MTWRVSTTLTFTRRRGVVRVDETHEALAWQIFEQYADQQFSYTDCTSFAVMQALNLSEAFTADRHFAIMGFTLVP